MQLRYLAKGREKLWEVEGKGSVQMETDWTKLQIQSRSEGLSRTCLFPGGEGPW